MTKRKKRKTYTQEFKAEAVRLVAESGRGVTVVAAELGIAQPTLSRWIYASTAVENGEAREQRLEILELRQQLKAVTQERDFLRDAATYFARAQK